MTEDGFDRRSFLKGTVVGGAAAIASSLPKRSEAQPKAAAVEGAPPAAYAFLNADEAAFVETVVDHMIPADGHSPKGTDLGLAYSSTARSPAAGARGSGSTCRARGSRAPRTRATSCRSPPRSSIARASPPPIRLRENLRQALRPGSSPPSARTFFKNLARARSSSRAGCPRAYSSPRSTRTVMEGMFADPIYGGNKNKAGWKMSASRA